jgi:protein-S-isoprenylcysteine O-methyltransferase Ste14
MAIAFAWLGGGAFVGALAYFLYTYAVTLGRPAPPGANVPLSVVADLLLFLAFATHHSLFARPYARRWVTRAVPASLERTVYVWIASLLLILACAAWQPLPGSLYRSGGWLAAPHFALVAAGLLLTALGARRLSPLRLAGIEQARRHPPRQPEPLVTSFPYNLVRHPIYLGWILVVFGVPHMTWSRMLMALVSTTYLAVAVRWEERVLGREFGDAYAQYRRRVRWKMVPGVY